MITEVTMKRGVRAAAREASLSPGYLSRIVNGRQSPGKKTAKRLRALGVDVPEQPAARKGGAE